MALAKLPRAEKPLVENLEGRMMLAANLPAGFSESELVRGFNTPTSMEFAPDGRLFVTEKNGAVKIAKGGRVLDRPFLQLQVNNFAERGLQSIEFDPDFERNGHVYVYYTSKETVRNRLSRFTVSQNNADLADPNSEVVLLDNILTPTGYHNGGAMHFGNDKMLYLGIGDGGSRSADGQTLTQLNAKILRLNVTNYPRSIIPSDNPFVNVSGARKEIYAIGFRNPFTGAVDPVTGKLYINDVGNMDVEEVNHVQSGKNYGWPKAEGPSSNPAYTDPIYSWRHDSNGQGAATGGVFYRGSQFPGSMRGNYFVADFTQEWIRRVDADGRSHTFATNVERAIDLDVGPDGSLYYLSAFGDGYAGDNRPVMKISFSDGGNRAPEAKASADKTSGDKGMRVRFSADGSSDPDDDSLTYRWNFGNGKTATGRNVTHRFTSKGVFNVVLTVDDGRGGSDTSQPIRINVGNRAPQLEVNFSKGAKRYRAGSEVVFDIVATDREDGKLASSSVTWGAVFHHRKHSHPYLPEQTGTSGSFRIPREYEPDHVQFYRIHVTATDSGGLETSKFFDIRPRLSRLTLRTNIQGLRLNLDNQPFQAGKRIRAVEGMHREIEAPLTQELNGKVYEFVRWSDGGKNEHRITIPKKNEILTAKYRVRRNR